MDLSLRDLADRCGVSAPMLSQLERGVDAVAQRGDIAGNNPGSPSDDEVRGVIAKAI